MSRKFLYARVSTSEQTTDNQVLEAQQAGFDIDPRRIEAETISGSKPAAERPGFGKLLIKMEAGDVLIVTKLDRLGRDTEDVLHTVEGLAQAGISVHCLALPGTDLTSASGKLVMTILAAIANFERDLIIERTMAGLARAKKEGKRIGRRAALTPEQKAEALARLAAGESARVVGKALGVSHTTILKVAAH